MNKEIGSRAWVLPDSEDGIVAKALIILVKGYLRDTAGIEKNMSSHSLHSSSSYFDLNF